MTMEETRDFVRSLKLNRTPGIDNLKPEIFNKLKSQLCKLIGLYFI